MNDTLIKNKQYSEGYFQKLGKLSIPLLLKPLLDLGKIKSVIDLGCGDGYLLTSLNHYYPDIDLSGVDISSRRIECLKKKFPKFKFIEGDVMVIPKEGSYDLVCNTQVIEHIDSPLDLIKQMSKLVKKDGFIFVTSVIKKHWAVYKYRNNGKFVLDPTHVSEFKSSEEFFSLFKDFKIISKRIFPVSRKVFGLTIRIPGFYIVEVLVKK